MSELHDIAKTARDASYIMASLRSDVKNKALANVAAALKDSKDEIFAANKISLMMLSQVLRVLSILLTL